MTATILSWRIRLGLDRKSVSLAAHPGDQPLVEVHEAIDAISGRPCARSPEDSELKNETQPEIDATMRKTPSVMTMSSSKLMSFARIRFSVTATTCRSNSPRGSGNKRAFWDFVILRQQRWTKNNRPGENLSAIRSVESIRLRRLT